MKFTIWEQFSSNHSSGFFFVGQFPSETESKIAGQKLQAILDTLCAWWQQYETLEERSEVYDTLMYQALTPVEQELKEKYDLQSFELSLDWWVEFPTSEGHIQVVRDTIILYPSATWNGPRPFIELVEKLGGNVACSADQFENQLFLRLEYTLSDNNLAEEVWQHIEQFYDSVNKSIIRVPGMQYTRGEVERHGTTIKFDKVGLNSHDFRIPYTERLSFHAQLHAFLKFFETYSHTSMHYEFYHTPPYEISPSEEPQ